MTDNDVEAITRRAIGGDPDAVSWVLEHADAAEDAVVLALAALLERRGERLATADAVARSSHDRQVVAITRAYLDGRRDLVDALARDHLVDHPASLIVSWLAARAAAEGARPTSASSGGELSEA